MGRILAFLVVLLAAAPAWADGCDDGGGFLGSVFDAVRDAQEWVADRAGDVKDKVEEGWEAFKVQTSDDLFPWIRKPGAGTPAAVASCNGKSGGLKVMSYNIRSTRESSLDRIARDINSEAPDFVALQEVDVRGARTAFKDQPKELSKRTGLRYHAFGKAADRGFLVGGYGNAILSKYPILSARTWNLPSKSEQRVMICATVAAPAGESTLCSVHLGLNGAERMEQVQAIERIISGFPDDRVVLLGDFNETPDKPAIRFLRNQGWRDTWELAGEGQPYTSTAVRPTKRIDFVFVRDGSGFDPGCTHVPNVTGSDHRPVVTTLY